ncbi:MAG: RidA family protein [Pseudomonadota bacterium]
MSSADPVSTRERAVIATDRAPAAIGTYSQAVRLDALVFLSGQIPLDPATMTLVEGDFSAQAERAFQNLAAVCEAAGGSLNDIGKLTVYLTDLGNFADVNATMERHFTAPFPARAAIEVSALPKGALIEVDAIMALPPVDRPAG